MQKTQIPPAVLDHLLTHGIEQSAPKSNDAAVNRLIEHEDAGCTECSSLLDRYIKLAEAC